MNSKTKTIVTSSMMIGIATLLSIFKPFALPFGGGITIASMMPIILIGYIFGTKAGLLSAFAYSVIQMMLDPGVIGGAFLPGEDQMVLYKAILMCLIDYTLAFSVLGLGGIFKGKMKNSTTEVMAGAVFATVLRYIMHIISGFILWGSYAEWFFSQENFYAFGEKALNTFSGYGLSIIYSVVYNGLYMVPEIVITAILTPLVYKAIKKGNVIG